MSSINFYFSVSILFLLIILIITIQKGYSKMAQHTELNYQSIGDCYYDIYCQPELTTKEDLLKDMVKILNGEITKQDYIEEIKQWNKEREE